MSTFKNKRIKLELLRLPSKIDNIDINYVKKGIKTSDTSINYKVNKDYRNLIIYINNITIPETYPYNPLCLDYINIIICEGETILAKLKNKNEIMNYFKNQIEYSKGFCDYYKNSWSPAITIKTFSLMLSHDLKFMISKKLDIEKEILIKEIIEYKTDCQINEVYLIISKYLDDDLFILKTYVKFNWFK